MKDIIKRNNIQTYGSGQPMLFAHGFGCDQNMWRFVTPEFQDDYRIISFDYVGSGKSEISAYNTERYTSLQGYAQDILEICEALKLTDVILVGHSVSSMIGLLAAIERPDYFSNIVMVGPSACYINEEGYIGGFERQDIEELLETMERNYIGWANFLAPAVMGNKNATELSEELAESFCSTDPVIASQFARATFFSDNRQDLSKLRVPSLILQCSEDIIAPSEVGTFLHHNLPGSELQFMKATGHCPHMSDPEETVSLIRQYLSTKR